MKNKELHNFNDEFQIKKRVINKCLLTGDSFMPEFMHLKQPEFTYSACEPFTKRRERIQKCRETGNSNHLFRNELDKTCLAHEAAYSLLINI